MATTSLNNLLELLHIPCRDTRTLKGISDNSREIEKDWLFVCRKGHEEDGSRYIEEALKRGGVVLCSHPYPDENVYTVPNVERILQTLLELYYGDLCRELTVIGITGTNGKTSVASILNQLLHKAGNRVMQIGTGNVTYDNQHIEIHNTTPGCFQLANYFREAIRLEIPYVVMEVSSHAIDQNRINFLHFDYIVYTNITQDHLDYHLTRTHYRYTKFKLRRYLKPQGTIIYNADLSYMQELVHLAHHTSLGIGLHGAHFPIEDVQLTAKGSAFTLQGYRYETRLLSMANVYNIAQALVILRRIGISYDALQELVKELKPVKGRLEVIDCVDFTIWIDYAHTTDALHRILEFAAQVKKGRVITVIGCGGNRDKQKRPMMAYEAYMRSDETIFTSDNPRDESIHAILADMMHPLPEHVQVFENRYFAIKHTIKMVQNDDIIIIAGKGCEEVQTVFGKEYPFSDRRCVLERLTKEELHWK